MPSIPSANPDTKSLPRILCLHGGGVNGTIFEFQARSLIPHLQQSFRLVWADGPFLCDPHPDVVNVYGSFGPFRRWVRWLPGHPEIDDESNISEIGYSLRTAMEDDDRKGGTGEWVGLMGFSQGAKLAASLLLEQQSREEQAFQEDKELESGLIGIPGVHWRFGVLLAGRAPPTNLNPKTLKSKALVEAGTLSDGFEFRKEVDQEAMLRIPTLHVHGMADPGLDLHRILLHDYCVKGTTTLIEWEGAHRIPIKTKDVAPILDEIYNIAANTGVKVKRTV